MGKLTDKQIAGLKPRSARYERWDGRGLGVRVTPGGVKTFVYVYHFEGRSRRLTLGRYRSADDVKSGRAADGIEFMTLTQARQAAERAREQLEEGIDPGAVKALAQEEERLAETFEDVAKLYLDLYAKPKKRSWKEDQRIINRELIPAWGKKKARSITKKDVVELADKIAARPAPIMANRVISLCSKIFRWATAREHVPANPAEFVPKPGKERKRERRLLANQVKAFWWGLDGIEDCPLLVRTALRLALVTGQRRAEVAGLPTVEIDEGAALWKLPPARAKDDRPHLIPLPDLALRLIRDARFEAAKICDCDPSEVTHLFPTQTRTGKPRYRTVQVGLGEPIRELMLIHPDTLTDVMCANALDLVGKKLSPHDLRRTFHSLLGEEPLSVSRFLRDRLINHADLTAGAHYDMYEYLPEKREAMKAWGAYLEQLIGAPSGNVVALRG